MLKAISLTGCLGLAVVVGQAAQVENQTGPVREGLRRTGEAVAEGTRSVVRGTGEAIDRAGEAVRNSADAVRDRVDSAERSALQTSPTADVDADGNLNAAAQAGPAQIQAGANQALDANGQIEGQVNDPALDGSHQSGYRGVDAQGAPLDQQQLNAQGFQDGQFQQGSQIDYNGRMHTVRHNSQGRPYICVGGCPVYLDEQGMSTQSHEAYKLSDDPMHHEGTHQGQPQNQGSAPLQQNSAPSETYAPQSGNVQPPAPPAPIRTDGINQAPVGANAAADAQVNAEQNRNLNEPGNIGAQAGADANADLNANSNSESAIDVGSDAGIKVETDSNK